MNVKAAVSLGENLFCRLTHQSRSAAEDESRNGRQIGKLLHHDQFSMPDVFNLGLEGWLPGIELQNLEGTMSFSPISAAALSNVQLFKVFGSHLDSIENFIHYFQPLVFALHVFNLKNSNNIVIIK